MENTSMTSYMCESLLSNFQQHILPIISTVFNQHFTSSVPLIFFLVVSNTCIYYVFVWLFCTFCCDTLSFCDWRYMFYVWKLERLDSCDAVLGNWCRKILHYVFFWVQCQIQRNSVRNYLMEAPIWDSYRYSTNSFRTQQVAKTCWILNMQSSCREYCATNKVESPAVNEQVGVRLPVQWHQEETTDIGI